MRPLHEWLAEYAESHRHPVNKRLHNVCVPAIMWSVVAGLWALRPAASASLPVGVNAGALFALAVLGYYVVLCPPLLALAMAGVVGLIIASCCFLEWVMASAAALALAAVLVFIIAWMGQFYGHHIEGRRPSFLKDLQFLLIGPLWVVAGLFPSLAPDV